MNEGLPPQLHALRTALPDSGADVPIIKLYRVLFPDDGTPDRELRNVQQRIGPYVARLNRRLKGDRRRVEPGVARHTYRLIATR